jgi:hypothetical protein
MRPVCRPGNACRTLFHLLQGFIDAQQPGLNILRPQNEKFLLAVGN